MIIVNVIPNKMIITERVEEQNVSFNCHSYILMKLAFVVRSFGVGIVRTRNFYIGMSVLLVVNLLQVERSRNVTRYFECKQSIKRQ